MDAAMIMKLNNEAEFKESVNLKPTFSLLLFEH